MTATDTSLLPAPGIDFDRYPQFSLCHRMTPIEAMPRLGEAVGGPHLYVKRDDCTGLATGGNKTRKLEFLVGEALSRKRRYAGDARRCAIQPCAPDSCRSLPCGT